MIEDVVLLIYMDDGHEQTINRVFQSLGNNQAEISARTYGSGP
jgi:hypothetical protein